MPSTRHLIPGDATSSQWGSTRTLNNSLEPPERAGKIGPRLLSLGELRAIRKLGYGERASMTG
jgi:hypothetical protein